MNSLSTQTGNCGYGKQGDEKQGVQKEFMTMESKNLKKGDWNN